MLRAIQAFDFWGFAVQFGEALELGVGGDSPTITRRPSYWGHGAFLRVSGAKSAADDRLSSARRVRHGRPPQHAATILAGSTLEVFVLDIPLLVRLAAAHPQINVRIAAILKRRAGRSAASRYVTLYKGLLRQLGVRGARELRLCRRPSSGGGQVVIIRPRAAGRLR